MQKKVCSENFLYSEFKDKPTDSAAHFTLFRILQMLNYEFFQIKQFI